MPMNDGIPFLEDYGTIVVAPRGINNRYSMCTICEGAGWDWKKAADDDLQVDDPVDYYFCEPCNGTGLKIETVENDEKEKPI